jgi:INO80 complex subunit C
MLLLERYELVAPNLPTYGSVAAPPSLLPATKYCDITGLPTQFTDPKTKLHFVDSSAFQLIRQLPQEATSRFLAKRGADTTIK